MDKMEKNKLKQIIKEEIQKILKEENSNLDKLYNLFTNSINQIDGNLSYKDLALIISKILKEQYGSHNYESFINILKSDLDIK